MGIPLSRLRNEVDEKDLVLYQAYDRIDPFGYRRSDINAAIISQTLAKINGIKFSKLSDFMLDYENPPQPKTAKQMFNIMAMASQKGKGKLKN